MIGEAENDRDGGRRRRAQHGIGHGVSFPCGGERAEALMPFCGDGASKSSRIAAADGTESMTICGHVMPYRRTLSG